MTDPTVSVIVGTFGDLSVWGPLAHRAARSALDQVADAEFEVLIEHEDTLAQARNAGAARARGEWLIFLDADDWLEPGYIQAMLGAQAPLRQPATRGVVDGRVDQEAVHIRPRGLTLLDGNHLVIGTMMPRVDFHAVGGFRELPAWEDWDLFIRLWLRGLSDTPVEDAVYRVTVSPGSRNDLQVDRAQRLFKEIRSQYLNEARLKGLVP